MARASDIATGFLIAVDWGTSRLRATLLDAQGHALAEARSDEGIGTITRDHEATFERLVGDWPKVPAIMTGMVGSRQGWREAAYVPCPATPAALAEKLLQFETGGDRRIAIVPGMMLRTAGGGDVIRGEETQIVGLLSREPDFAGTVVLPGTHSKWVRVANGAIASFQTFLTGELFELLARHSFLRHSVSGDGRDLGEAADFEKAVRRIAEDDLPFLAAVFSVRVRQLLDGVDPKDNLAYLSGLVIGGEIAAARQMGLLGAGALRIVGTEALVRSYGTALALLGHDAQVEEGKDLVVDGLVHLATASGFARIGSA